MLRRDVIVRETYPLSEVLIEDGQVLVTALMDEREDDLLEIVKMVVACDQLGCHYTVAAERLGEPEIT